MADNLESYFKKNLSDDNPGEENWNVPSDDVWNKALPEIQKKRGLFIPWRYFYLLGILLLAVLAFILWPIFTGDSELGNGNNLAVEENNQTPQNFNSSNEKITSIAIDEYNNTPAAKTSIEENTNSQQEELAATLSAENSNSSDKILGVSQSEQAVQSGFGNNTSQNQVITENELSKNNSFSITDASSKTQQINSIDPISSRSIDNISSIIVAIPPEKRTTTFPLDNEAIAKKKEPINNKGKFGVGVFVAPTFNTTAVSGDLNQGKIETSDMFLYSTNWGFELKYFVSNRFTLVTGIGKSEIRSWSKSVIDFNYDPSTEHSMPTGEKENTSAVPMQTPFGEIDTEITYRFPGDQDIPDGEPMYSVMETHQDLRYLTIPLGVEFNIIHFSQFNWFADAGVRYNRALKDATQFTSRVLHEGHDMDVVAEEMTSHPNYTENYLSFYVGTGINYQFTKGFQLNASGNYFGSLTKVNLQDNMSTYAHGFNFKFGIVYLF